jgi:hypothetical protein
VPRSRGGRRRKSAAADVATQSDRSINLKSADRSCHRGHRAQTGVHGERLGNLVSKSWIHPSGEHRCCVCSDPILCALLLGVCTTLLSSRRRLRGFFSSSNRNLQEETERTESASIQRSNSATDFSADGADGRGWVFTGERRGSIIILTSRSFRGFTEGNEGNEDQFSSHITRFVLLVTFCSIF